jgi:hypothetical protein
MACLTCLTIGEYYTGPASASKKVGLSTRQAALSNARGGQFVLVA